jgi:hypothetical protein
MTVSQIPTNLLRGFMGVSNIGKGLSEENNTEVVHGQYGQLIPYSECVLSHFIISIHEFGPKTWATILQSQAMSFLQW